MDKLLRYCSEVLIKNKLSLSSQELLRNCVMGLDGISRKLLVATIHDNHFRSFIIDLDEVEQCLVKKEYGAIKAGDFESNRSDRFVNTVSLCFELKNGKTNKEVLFYKHDDNHEFELPLLEKKARYWQAILSKMQMSVRKIA